MLKTLQTGILLRLGGPQLQRALQEMQATGAAREEIAPYRKSLSDSLASAR